MTGLISEDPCCDQKSVRAASRMLRTIMPIMAAKSLGL